ncbi:hypothetical protein [Tateyamaria omphalii]|uniref:Uncharacterized protein n=1 Tax=Tateyamaria omphalii TaxID=299262 RepID=A0A1P8MVN7_9RHOB|nr:hypothetical protein [Tateyamaria omphalii]APX12009.1 hypothetical protein BWR18_10205 [Tateyamaria omphalii]
MSPDVGTAVQHDEIGEADLGDSAYGARISACWSALPEDCQSITRWLTDWNNSRYRAAELSYVRVRMGERLAVFGEPDHPALQFRGISTAAPAMAVAVHADAPGRLLVTSGAPISNLRAAIVIILLCAPFTVEDDPENLDQVLHQTRR